MFLTRDRVEAEEERLRGEIRALSDAERKEFYRLAERRLKDPDTYAVLNYLFIAGLHHFYLGKWIRGLFNLAIFLGGGTLVVVGLAVHGFILSDPLTLGLALIGFITAAELWALFRAQVIAQDHNNRTMRALLRDLPAQRPEPLPKPPSAEAGEDG
jgi:TM2 domain-containing membrane protein YozV